jgi:hypothetical protein
MKGTYNQPAPGDLELVRQFLNTWVLPSATRDAEDRLPGLLADHAAWAQRFPALPLQDGDTPGLLVPLRDALRALAARDPHSWEEMQAWLERYPPQVRLVGEGNDQVVRHVSATSAGVAGAMLAIVIDAVNDGTWPRLKVCPDCRWVFYDRTRSRTKVWCDMLAGDAGGRACGTIAKVRRFRERQADAAAATAPTPP